MTSTAAYRVHLPDGPRSAVVFNSPHSGRSYPPSFLRESVLDPLTLRSSEDAFVDDLFARVPEHGAPLLAARMPRAFVDLNRAETEIDPAVVETDRRAGLNPRLAAGLGVIPRVVAEGRAIRSGKMTMDAAQARIATYHRPYHLKLAALLAQTRALHGESILLDCHSMPREALRGHVSRTGVRPEIVLGDRFGTACAPWIMDAVEAAFVAEGFVVTTNAPFAGGYITQTYGTPERGSHAVQIEIDRSLYMDESRIERRPDFAAFEARIMAVAARLSAIDPCAAIPLAAE